MSLIQSVIYSCFYLTLFSCSCLEDWHMNLTRNVIWTTTLEDNLWDNQSILNVGLGTNTKAIERENENNNLSMKEKAVIKVVTKF